MTEQEMVQVTGEHGRIIIDITNINTNVNENLAIACSGDTCASTDINGALFESKWAEPGAT
jgi:hypothetical protein